MMEADGRPIPENRPAKEMSGGEVVDEGMD